MYENCYESKIEQSSSLELGLVMDKAKAFLVFVINIIMLSNSES